MYSRDLPSRGHVLSVSQPSLYIVPIQLDGLHFCVLCQTKNKDTPLLCSPTATVSSPASISDILGQMYSLKSNEDIMYCFNSPFTNKDDDHGVISV